MRSEDVHRVDLSWDKIWSQDGLSALMNPRVCDFCLTVTEFCYMLLVMCDGAM